MTLNDQKGAFGVVYLQAVATVCGYSYNVPNIDDDSIDLTLNSSKDKRKLDFQAKCTSSYEMRPDDFSFEVSLKNYNDLRTRELMVPRLLAVVLVPAEASGWLEHDEEKTVLRRCGYWYSLRGMPETLNVSSVTVQIPRQNLLTPDSLRTLMERGQI